MRLGLFPRVSPAEQNCVPQRTIWAQICPTWRRFRTARSLKSLQWKGGNDDEAMDDRGPAQFCTRGRLRWGRFGELAQYRARGSRAGGSACARTRSAGSPARGSRSESGSCSGTTTSQPSAPRGTFVQRFSSASLRSGGGPGTGARTGSSTVSRSDGSVRHRPVARARHGDLD